MAEIAEAGKPRFRGLLSLPVLRPVAVSMLFLAVVLFGLVGVDRMPVELFPPLPADTLSVSFSRPGSTSDLVERELLIPLTSRVRALGGVKETLGQANGDSGWLRITFDRGTDLKVREYELRRIASRMQRESTVANTTVSVTSSEIGEGGMAAMFMQINVLGEGRNTDILYDLVVDRVVPRLAAVPGVASATPIGGGGRQVIVSVDPDKVASLGATIDQVTSAIQSRMGGVQYVGSVESGEGRIVVLTHGALDSLGTLRRTRISQDSPLTLEHVADIYIGYARSQSLSLIDGQPVVSVLLTQEQGTNIVEVGAVARKRIDELREEIRPLGLDLRIGLDVSEPLDEQIDRLVRLGATGFALALLVLFLFLRQWRAVAVVGIAVPVSLMTALASLYLLGHSINVLTLFGLAMAVGLLVDNSVVVYEAILRGIERGMSPTNAAREGLRKTARAIVGASITTATVFLPIVLIDIDNATIRSVLEVLSIAVIMPLLASLVVAIGLVPLLAHRLAAPAARQRVLEQRRKRAERAGMLIPDRARLLLKGFVTNALRHPPSWLAGTLIAIVVTVAVAGSWALGNQSPQDAEQSDSIVLDMRLPVTASVDIEGAMAAASYFSQAIKQIEGVDYVQTGIQDLEQGLGSIAIHFVEPELRPKHFSIERVRDIAANEARQLGVDTGREGELQYGASPRPAYGGYSSLFGGTASHEVVITGPDPRKLIDIGNDIANRLNSIGYVRNARVTIESRGRELHVQPIDEAMQAFGITAAETFPFLNIAGTSGQTLLGRGNYQLSTGREIPLVVEREGVRERNASRQDLQRLRIQTENGVIPVSAFTRITEMPPPSIIVHKNGRREMKVTYSLSNSVPDSGEARESIEKQIEDHIRETPRPAGYVIDIPADQQEENANFGQRLALIALGLLILVLAIIFESLTLPFLIIISVPLAVIGSLWGVALTGTPLLDYMVWVGVLVLIGLLVNPAILLIDRMQQFVRIGYSSGAAAYAAVKERTRPILLTTATTIAALWPLSIATGAEFEMWPPFAIVVMSGLASSALLTLVIVPVGYVMLRRLDMLFGRVGPWLVVAWMVSLIAIMFVLIAFAGLSGLFWQVVTGILVGGVLLAIVVLAFRRVSIPEPHTDDGPPELEVSYLSKVYGLPGPIRKTLTSHREFAAKVVEAGGKVFTRRDTFEKSLVFLILAAGAIGLGWLTPQFGWSLIFWLIASAFVARVFLEARKFRGMVTDDGRTKRGGIEGMAAVLLPWVTIAGFVYFTFARPLLDQQEPDASLFWPIVATILLFIGQSLRRSAVRQDSGELAARVSRGFMKYPRTWWRRMSKRIAGFDLPTDEIRALWSVSFTAKRGMIGILGPNGAGKTTLLRQLAGIINPTHGTITLGGVPLKSIQKFLARWVGYLPQDSGLPLGLTPREYLQYYAALYDIPAEVRRERVTDLIAEVGLAEKIDDKIGSLSGGMKQRVAVARTLLRLPAIIIVDEPTVGLDPRERIRFRNLLARLAETRIVLFSTHVVEDVSISCERVLVIAQSRLRFDGSPADLALNAEGRVWERRIEEGHDKSLPEGAILAEEAPDPQGTTVQRIIWDQEPAEGATQLAARPEDGYLWLLATT